MNFVTACRRLTPAESGNHHPRSDPVIFTPDEPGDLDGDPVRALWRIENEGRARHKEAATS
jgi:hypothetical protein